MWNLLAWALVVLIVGAKIASADPIIIFGPEPSDDVVCFPSGNVWVCT